MTNFVPQDKPTSPTGAPLPASPLQQLNVSRFTDRRLRMVGHGRRRGYQVEQVDTILDQTWAIINKLESYARQLEQENTSLRYRIDFGQAQPVDETVITIRMAAQREAEQILDRAQRTAVTLEQTAKATYESSIAEAKAVI